MSRLPANASPEAIGQALLNHFGPDACITGPEATAPWCADAWQMHRGRAAAVLRPANTAQVSAMMAWCHGQGVSVVPQGGNTGLVGGAIPDASGTQVVLSLSRLNRIRNIDAANNTATVDAGCILANVRQAVAEHDRLFPLTFGAEGSCQIGGALSTNAGGMNVLRYGNARDLVLGLEVVLHDGTVWNGLRRLRKDNTGYDLKHLFMGAEGTLGIITGAVLKLFPRPRSSTTALVALNTLHDSTALLALARSTLGDTLSAFELIADRLFRLVDQHLHPVNYFPPGSAQPWYALLQFDGFGSQMELDAAVQTLLATALDEQLVTDAVLPDSLAQWRHMWQTRDAASEAQLRNGAVVYFDISVPVSSVPHFIDLASQALKAADPTVDLNIFGHAGDGNLHFNLLQPAGMAPDDFLARKAKYVKIVYDTVEQLQGSISAEHGIGAEKRLALVAHKPATDIALMRAIRQAIAGEALNPGKTV